MCAKSKFQNTHTVQYYPSFESVMLIGCAYRVYCNGCALCTLPIKRIKPSNVCNNCNQIFHNNCGNLSIYSKERKCLICLDIMPTPSTSKNTDSTKLDELIKTVKSLEKKFSI